MASGLRKADQWPAPAAAAFEALEAAQAMRLKSVKNRIILVCLLGRDFLFGHLEVLVADAARQAGSMGLDWPFANVRRVVTTRWRYLASAKRTADAVEKLSRL